MTDPVPDASSPLEFFAAALDEARSGLGTVRVAVLGRSGAGKSTLVNAIFGAELADAAVGAPVTVGLVEHRRPGVPLSLVDSAGLELGGTAGSDMAGLLAEEVERRARLGVDEALHVVWYCVDADAARFEPAEQELVRRCAELVPTIVVLTKAVDPADPAVQELRATAHRLAPAAEAVVPVLAAERAVGSHTFPAHGLQELVATTSSALPEAARRAFVVSQRLALEQQVAEGRAVVARRALAAAPFAGGDVDAAERLARHQLRMLAEVSAVFSLSVPEPTMRALVAGVARGADGVAGLTRVVLDLLAKQGVGGIEVVDRLLTAGSAVAATRALGEAYVRVCQQLAQRRADGRPVPDAELLALFLRAVGR